MTGTTPQRLRDAARMREMLFGHLLSAALCAAASLDLPDLLFDRPRAVSEIAEVVGAHPVSLTRLLRGLCAYEVFTEPEPGVFAVTELGRTLCTGVPGTARPSADLVAGVVGATWGTFSRTVRSGTPSFDELFGCSFFEYLDRKPELARTFAWSQAEGLVLELPEILGALELADRATIVDVGGGDGALLAELLGKYPMARGVLLELPATAELAQRRFAALDLTDRVEVVPGSFFEEIPAGGRAYLLSHVLHDWNDADCLAVLRRCAAVMPADAALFVVDLVTLEPGEVDASYRYASLLDMYMLSLFGGGGGRERTASEFRDLLVGAGFGTVQVRRLPSGMACIEAHLPT